MEYQILISVKVDSTTQLPKLVGAAGRMSLELSPVDSSITVTEVRIEEKTAWTDVP